MYLGALACELQILPWWVAVGVAVGNTLGPVAAVTTLRRLRFDPAFAGRRDLLAYFVAGVVGMTITASNGTAWQAAGGLPGGNWRRRGWCGGWATRPGCSSSARPC